MTDSKKIIDPLSVVSLLLETSALGKPLGRATGFVVKKEGRPYLITNWHVVTGRNSETLQPLSPTAALPDQITIAFHEKDKLGSWILTRQSLANKSGKPIWIEHERKYEIDVVAIPLEPLGLSDKMVFYDLDLTLSETDMIPQCAMPVSIIGFPLGLTTAGVLPIWKTGHIASDHDLDHDSRPSFLIDATTREGMSGAPVLLRLTGGYKQKNGNSIISSGLRTRFLGIYSGRIHDDSEIGRVWRPQVITEIIDRANIT
ncbi:serine protease [Patescibacteria group bacterium]|nr:serine protease [Patescibacteria group bacterium]